MPAVREPGEEAPATLEVVEVRPGVRLKLNAADKEAILDAQAADAEARRAWDVANVAVGEDAAPRVAAPNVAARRARKT